jgi:hypothetical protein
LMELSMTFVNPGIFDIVLDIALNPFSLTIRGDHQRYPCGIINVGICLVLELEIKHKHGGFNINYEKATVVWQQFGFAS